MAQLESLICEACRVGHETIILFDDENCRPVSGTCGHSACEVCVELDPKMRCPICYRREAFVAKTINYAALGFRAEYEKDVFDVIRKWWTVYTSVAAFNANEYFSYASSDFGKENPSYGYCAKCAVMKGLKICLTCKFSRKYAGMDVVGYAVCDDCATAEYDNQDMEDVRQHGDVKTDRIECHICKSSVEDAKFHGPLLNRKMNNPDARFMLCSDCLLDDHEDHKTCLKKLFDGSAQKDSIVKTATKILGKLLRSKLSVEESQIKCRLRYKRMMLTCSELLKIVNDPYTISEVGFTSSYPDIGQGELLEGTFARTLKSLETQYEQFRAIDSVCKCVCIWDRIVKLEVFDSKGRSPHFHSMADKSDLEENIDVCPYDLKSSGPEKRSLLEIIKKGETLTAPFKMEIRREVRRARVRHVYHFPSREDEVQKVSSYSAQWAYIRETGAEMVMSLRKLEPLSETSDGNLLWFNPDGTVDRDAYKPQSSQ